VTQPSVVPVVHKDQTLQGQHSQANKGRTGLGFGPPVLAEFHCIDESGGGSTSDTSSYTENNSKEQYLIFFSLSRSSLILAYIVRVQYGDNGSYNDRDSDSDNGSYNNSNRDST